VITRRVPFTTYLPISRSPTSSLRYILGRGVDGRRCNSKINRPTYASKKVSSSPTSQVLLNWFSKHNGRNKYKYNVTNSQWIDLDSIISTVTLTFKENANVYTLDANDRANLDEFVSTNK
jgi:hypothetical protein